MTDPWVAWAAGLFEGEGSVIVCRKRNAARPSARLQINMTDRDVMQRFAQIVGRQALGPYPHGPNKPRYVVQLNGFAEVRRIFTMFAPYLGERRRTRFMEVLGVEPTGLRGNANRDKTHCKRGHEFTPANTYVRPMGGGGRRGRDCRRCALDRKARTVE